MISIILPRETLGPHRPPTGHYIAIGFSPKSDSLHTSIGGSWLPSISPIPSQTLLFRCLPIPTMAKTSFHYILDSILHRILQFGVDIRSTLGDLPSQSWPHEHLFWSLSEILQPQSLPFQIKRFLIKKYFRAKQKNYLARNKKLFGAKQKIIWRETKNNLARNLRVFLYPLGLSLFLSTWITRSEQLMLGNRRRNQLTPSAFSHVRRWLSGVSEHFEL
jgi:hypothetical protein